MKQVLCPVLVGRDRELESVDAAGAATLRRHGGVLVVSGEAGIGKSRLVVEAERRAEARGLRVLRGRASYGGDVPYRPLAEAVQSAFRDHAPPAAPKLAPFRALLGRLVPEWSGRPAGATDSPFVFPTAVLHLLRVLAHRGGVLLVIEDVQWADADTLAVIEYLAEQLGSDRLLCICTERSDAPGPAAAMFTRLVSRRAAVRIALGPLPDEAVEEMARLSLGIDAVSPAVVSALRGRANGVPFLVEELLSAYIAAGGPVERRADWWLCHRVAKALPHSHRDLVHARLASVGKDTRRVVASAAVLDRTFDRRLIGLTTGLAEPKVRRALHAAVEALLVRCSEADPATFSFRHALAREAVIAELTPRDRAELSARAADAIEAAHPGLPGGLCERAADLRAQAGDGLGAHRLLQESGRRALARGALASAESSLERAHELAAGDVAAPIGADELLIETLALEGKTERLEELGRGLVNAAGPADSARAVLRPRLARLNLHVAQCGLLGDDVTLAGDCLARARELADDEALVARMESMAARHALAMGVPERAQALARAAARVGRRRDLIDLRCEALETLGRAALRLGDVTGASAAFEHMEEVARGGGLVVQQLRALVELGTLDHLIGAEPGRLRDAERLAVRTGAVSALARIDLELAWMHLGLAELEAARGALRRTLEASRSFRLRLLQHAHVAETTLHALMRRPEKLERARGAALAAADGNPDIEAATLGNGTAVLKLVLGDEAGALDDLERAVAVASRAGDQLPWWFHGLWALLKTAREDRDMAGAPLRGDPALANPANRAYLAYAEALAARVPAQAAAAFDRADRLMPRGWRRHHARLVVGERAGDWGEPGLWAEEALAFAGRAGVDWLTARARPLLGPQARLVA